MFQFPGFAPLRVHHKGVGCPIQKSPDQSLFAAPRRLSQRITSFIASSRQGIHQMPLRHLITLISNNHKGHLPKEVSNDSQQKQSLISTWHTLNRSICIKDIHEVCLDQFMRHNWRGSGQAPPWTQSLRIMLTG